jgi:hypothetical protein
MNSVHILKPYFNIHFNIILLYSLRIGLPRIPFPSSFQKFQICFQCVLRTCLIHPHWFDHRNNISWRVIWSNLLCSCIQSWTTLIQSYVRTLKVSRLYPIVATAQFYTCSQAGLCSGKSLDLGPGGILFKSHPGYRVSWQVCRGFT